MYYVVEYKFYESVSYYITCFRYDGVQCDDYVSVYIIFVFAVIYLHNSNRTNLFM